MPASFQTRPDRRSGPILATTLVLFLGAIGVAVMVSASGANPYWGLLVFVVFAAIAPALGLFLRVTPQRTLASAYSWIRSREQQLEEEYQPRASRSRKTYGTNRPPSAEELRDLKGGTNNWVPSNVPPPSRRPKRS